MTLRDRFYYVAGLGFLALAKTKNVLQGYSSPKPFNISLVEQCIDYDFRVVEHWLASLSAYTEGTYALAGKNVLELGPGSDLGIGIYLLAKGCLQYNACDVNDLAKSVPDGFYEKLFSRIEEIRNPNLPADIAFLREQLGKQKAGNMSRLNYVVRDNFDLVSAFGESNIDLVFSQAAFEHFDDIEATISQLSTVCRPGAILVVEIDLKTHSRWIRDRDPNNIYRFPDHIYNAFWFRGIPNRVRPYQYKEALERCGWGNISISPLRLAKPSDSHFCGDKKFADEKNQMDHLSIMVCARRK